MDVQIFSGVIGNLDIHQTKNGNFVHTISVGISKWDKKDKKNKTLWKKVQVWNSNYVQKVAQKGMKITVHGETAENEWVDKNNQKRRDQFCLVIEGKGSIELHQNNKPQGGGYQGNQENNQNDNIEDDMPF